MLGRILIALVLASALACDKPHTLVLDPPARPNEVRLESLAQLKPNRPTHVVVDSFGNLYWSQESDDGQDVMFVMGQDGLARATLLTSRAILAAMGPVPQSSKSKPSARKQPGGNIQSLALGQDGKIYFFFSGSSSAYARAALGSIDPRSDRVRLIATNEQLDAATGMGHTLELARGTLITTGSLVRLLLRHTDAWALLDYDTHKIASDSEEPLVKSIERMHLGTLRLDLTDDQIELFTGPEAATILLRDLGIGAMYVVDSAGAAKWLTSLVLLPRALSDPLIEPAKSADDEPRLLMFAADSAVIDPLSSTRADPADVHTTYPALLLLSLRTGKYTAIGRDDIHAPGQFAVYAIDVRQIVPLTKDTYAGYDRASGQLLRIRITSR